MLTYIKNIMSKQENSKDKSHRKFLFITGILFLIFGFPIIGFCIGVLNSNMLVYTSLGFGLGLIFAAYFLLKTFQKMQSFERTEL